MMKIVKKKLPLATGPKKKKRVIEKRSFALPVEKSEPISMLSQASFLIFGEPKVGKTTFCTHWKNPIFFMTEPGDKALSIHKVDLFEWGDVTGYTKQLFKSHDFETIVVDNIDNVYLFATKHVCRSNGVAHINDIGYGKGQDETDALFRSWIMDLTHKLGMGVVLTSHAQSKEIDTVSGETYQRIIPTMAKRAARIVIPVVDMMCYYAYVGEKRYLYLIGDDHIEAGGRLGKEQGRFRYTNGESIKRLQMGKDSSASYAKLEAAFDNKIIATSGGAKPDKKKRSK